MKTKLITLLLASFLLGCSSANAAPSSKDLEKFASGPADTENISFGYRLLEASPDDASLLAVQGRTLVAVGKGAEAIPLLQKAIKEAHKTGEHLPSFTVRKLAEAYFEIGKYAEASTILDEVAPNHPDAIKARDVALTYGLANEYRKWTIIETAHLRLHFSPSFNEVQCRDFARSREEAFESVNAFFKATLPKKIDYFVWSNLKEAKRVADITILGFATPFACVIHSRYNQSPGHELTHVISFQATHPDNRTRLINEGVAVYFNLQGTDRLAAARNAVQSTKANPVSIAKYWSSAGNIIPENPLYSIAGAFAERLHQKGGDEKFLRLCGNQTYEAAREIYGTDLDTWISEFENDLNSPGPLAQTTKNKGQASSEETAD